MGSNGILGTMGALTAAGAKATVQGTLHVLGESGEIYRISCGTERSIGGI